MFADFIEFQTRQSTVCLNREQVICAWLAEDWNNPVNNATPGYVGLGLMPPPMPAQPVTQPRTLVIVKTQSDRGGEDIHFTFATEEEAKRVYELIRDGIA